MQSCSPRAVQMSTWRKRHGMFFTIVCACPESAVWGLQLHALSEIWNVHSCMYWTEDLSKDLAIAQGQAISGLQENIPHMLPVVREGRELAPTEWWAAALIQASGCVTFDSHPCRASPLPLSSLAVSIPVAAQSVAMCDLPQSTSCNGYYHSGLKISV